MLSYPSDEVGNHLIDPDIMDEKGCQSLERCADRKPLPGAVRICQAYLYRGGLRRILHLLIREEGAEVEVLFANAPEAVLSYTKDVLVCDIHTRNRSKRRLRAAGAATVFGLTTS